MVPYGAILVTIILVSLLSMKCGAGGISKQPESTDDHSNSRYSSACHDGFMSVYIPKRHFADLPFTLYIQDGHGGYHQAVAVANQCNYMLRETKTFINLTVPSHGCFVRRQKYISNLSIVIMRHAEKGRLEIVKTIHAICERKPKEMNKYKYSLVSRNLFCNKNGFEITILKNAAVPPLDLDAVWVPSGQSANCQPHNRSGEAVTFSFSFTECGTQFMVEDGVITYWVSVEVKAQKGSIFRDTPFNLTVYCSFMLAPVSLLGFGVQQEKPQDLLTLKGEGILRTEMRFAKDSTYRFFYSARDPPVVKLGLPVYVEVYVLKHENQDLVLLLEDCWATPTKNPHDTLRWNILVQGCPFRSDSQKAVLLPVVSSEEMKHPSLHKWMAIKLFSFLKSKSEENLVYLHCAIKICKGTKCSQSCNNERRKTRWITQRFGQRILYHVVSAGPLLYLM
ncbi:zona pellucida sperm-binding protein 4-like [Halichoeres trimaculatus]|uniref:zona pellucida sperm-binding protein 4-like n=1 Tax=Halichoeres trimaculatus TaxID=147232 RepID=UPI003D9DC3C7